MTVMTGSSAVRIADVASGGSPPSDDVYVSIRPEDLELHACRPRDALNVLEGRVALISYLGNFVEYVVESGGREWRVQVHPHDLFDIGAEVFLELPPACCLCLPRETA